MAQPIEPVEGRVKTPDDVTLLWEAGNETDARWAFDGGLREGSISEMVGELEIKFRDQGELVRDNADFELTRISDSDPRSLALAAVQAVYDRNFYFLADHGHPDWEEFVQDGYPNDFRAPTFAGAIENQFEHESDAVGEYNPPPAGVTLEFDPANVREEQENESEYYMEFDTVASGEEVNVEVALRTAGVDEETAWNVYGVEMEYPGQAIFFLGDS